MSTEQRYDLSGATMGTRYSAVFYAAEVIDQGALQAELQQAVDRVDRQMSTWQADSDLMRLNAAPPGHWVELPEELLWVMATALQIGEQSGGAFDIGVGALVSACGFSARRPPPSSYRRGRRAHGMRWSWICHGARHARIPASAWTSTASPRASPSTSWRAACKNTACHNFLVGIDGEMRAAE